MTNTTRKKKNNSIRSKGLTNGRRRHQGGSSGAGWAAFAVIIAVICGAGCYFYKNGIPDDWHLFPMDSQEVTSSVQKKDTAFTTTVQRQKELPKQLQQEEKKNDKEKTAVGQSDKHKESTQKSTGKKQQQSVAKHRKQQKETSKFVAPTYKQYHQGRWGYDVLYPSFLTQVIRSENNDGCRFADYEGTEFITYGSWNATEATIKELYREKLEDNMKVTYKRLYKEANYFIKFGYTKDGRMFYMKQVIADKLKEAPVITGILYFRPESKKGSEEVIKKIFDHFPY